VVVAISIVKNKNSNKGRYSMYYFTVYYKGCKIDEVEVSAQDVMQAQSNVLLRVGIDIEVKEKA